MIMDQLSNASLYDGVHPRLKKGFAFLLENDLHTLPVGKYEIENDKVFVMIQEYNTKLIEDCRLEAHYQYTDIQYVIKGAERMVYTNKEATEIDEEQKENDVMFLKGEGNHLIVNEGCFAVFMPQDAHMPGVCVEQPQAVRKAVVKVLCD
ncbi:YhcH/YjgK/YiaL family protein [Pradoshia sp.]